MICILFFEDDQIHGALDPFKAYFLRTSITGWIHVANSETDYWGRIGVEVVDSLSYGSRVASNAGWPE